MDVLQSISNFCPGYFKRYTVAGDVHKQSNLLIGSICKRETVYVDVHHTMASGCVYVGGGEVWRPVIVIYYKCKYIIYILRVYIVRVSTKGGGGGGGGAQGKLPPLNSQA